MFSQRLWGLALLTALTGMLGACAEPVEDVDRTQPNALKKSLFQGEWYFAKTVVDAPYETTGTFVGDRQEWLIGSEDFPTWKVRWRIEEDSLIACRADEVVVGSNTNGTDDHEQAADPQKDELRAANDAGAKFPCDHPLAAFPISGHFDIIRDYNASTGEQSNVISENTSDRHWDEREYFRIDWTDSRVKDINYSLWSQADVGWGAQLQNGYYVQEEEGDCRVDAGDGAYDYSACHEGFLPPQIEERSILVTNRFTLGPYAAVGPNQGDGFFACLINNFFGYATACTSTEIGVRYSFMRVPERAPEEIYEPIAYPDKMFERFGTWRVTKNTFTRGRGQTDFREYLATSWHLWDKTREACDSGDDCVDGYRWLDKKDRGVRPIVYHLNRDFPPDLKKMAFQVSKEWNDAYNDVHEGIDITESCQVVCAGGKSFDECTNADEDWRMEGTCAFELRENDGNQFLGDLRYSYIAFIEDPGSTPCGVGGPANDPETGELINGVSYIYGATCFDYIETRVMDMVDILCAQHAREGDSELPTACRGIDENQYLRGLRVLEVMEAQGRVQPPSTPIDPITGSAYALDNPDANERAGRLIEMRDRMEELSHHRGALHHNAAKLKAAGVDRLMIPDELAAELSGGLARHAHELSQEEIDHFNPLAPNQGVAGRLERRVQHLASRAIEPAEYLFNDRNLWALATQYLDKSRDEFTQILREQAFRAVTLHELGHNMGLRHNFIASFDRANYFPEYWEMRKSVDEQFVADTGRELPSFTPFWDEDDETRDEYLERYKVWDEDRNLLRDMYSDSGVRQFKYSSIMDYSGLNYNDWNGLGEYDKAAMRFLYANKVDRIDCTSASIDECGYAGKLNPDARDHVQFYLGGELCQTDDDCPGKAHGQTCDGGRGQAQALGVKLCTNWDDDEVRPRDGRTRQNVRHKFCSDDRVRDRPFCNRFDEGESSEEIVRTMIETYERGFVFNNFRRYRQNFDTNSYFSRIFNRYFVVIGDQMQSLLYKYFNEPGFRGNDGEGGFQDMLRATVIGFDFLGNVLAQPQAGSYLWDEDEQIYDYLRSDLHDRPSAELVNIPLGQGKTLYSSYEEGYFGEVDRLSYVGVFYDKLAALLTLTTRDWGASTLGADERFLLNFYDYFRDAYTNLLGAFIANETQDAALGYDFDTGVLQQRTYWDGTFFNPGEGFDVEDVAVAGRPIQPGATFYLGRFALIYGAVNTSYFLDVSFTSSMRLFEVGGNTGFSIDHIDEDSVVDCISPLTNRRFAAVQTEIQPSIAVRAVNRCAELSARWRLLEDGLESGNLPGDLTVNEAEDERDTVERRLSNQESRMANMIQIYDILGIGSL